MRNLTTLLCLIFIPFSLLAQNGNVGIGKKNPEEKLHVAGKLRVDSLAGNAFRIVTADEQGTLVADRDVNSILLYDSSGLYGIQLIPEPLSFGLYLKDSLLFGVFSEAPNWLMQGNENGILKKSDLPPPLTGDQVFYQILDLQYAVAENGKDVFTTDGERFVAERKQPNGTTKVWLFKEGTPFEIYFLDKEGKKTYLDLNDTPIREEINSPTTGSETSFISEDNSVKLNANGIWISSPTLSNDLTSNKIKIDLPSVNLTVGSVNDAPNIDEPGFHVKSTSYNAGVSMSMGSDVTGNYNPGLKIWGNTSSSTISPSTVSLTGESSSLSQTSSDISIMGPGQNIELNQTGLKAYSKDYSQSSGFDFSAGSTTNHVGNFHVAGNSSASGAKSFVIDHPLDPQNKKLYHFSMESNEVLNHYSGNVITDGNGYATVFLPEYFEAINKDFRYQLTVVGSFSRAMISKKINNNRFEIRTEEANTEVSWEVTAIRNDPYLRKNPVEAETEKGIDKKGKLLSDDD